jgi:hypothetical protein
MLQVLGQLLDSSHEILAKDSFVCVVHLFQVCICVSMLAIFVVPCEGVLLPDGIGSRCITKMHAFQGTMYDTNIDAPAA